MEFCTLLLVRRVMYAWIAPKLSESSVHGPSRKRSNSNGSMNVKRGKRGKCIFTFPLHDRRKRGPERNQKGQSQLILRDRCRLHFRDMQTSSCFRIGTFLGGMVARWMGKRGPETTVMPMRPASNATAHEKKRGKDK